MQINKEIITKEAEKFITHIFLLPETESVRVKDIVVRKGDSISEKLQKMVEKSYHDCYSDMDLHVTVRINPKDSMTPSEYLKRADRFGLDDETCLGLDFASDNRMYRIVMRNGVRYDMGIDFVYDDKAGIIQMLPVQTKNSNPNWPLQNVNRFWFVQVQALGKLYRKDYLIGDHLANMNLNETLVQQMVLRDLKYGTNHHRYGYEEELTYLKYKKDCPIKANQKVVQLISEKLYCAALAYDELTSAFYPEYRKRSQDYFELWQCYEHDRMQETDK